MKKKNYAWHISAFLIPFAVSVLLCAGQGVYPFGDRCILHVDMYHQYCPFFTEFMNKLKSGGSLQYSWNLGLGSDFVALYAYYLASPLNFLLILWPKNYVIEFMTLLTWIKLGLCGLNFFLFLRGHFAIDTDRWEKGYRIRVLYPALIFSLAYAFSGYITAYSWNIMWLDGVMLAPLVILGLEKLMDGKNAALYYVSLSLAIFSNYYIAFMICIFLVLYFVAYLIIKDYVVDKNGMMQKRTAQKNWIAAVRFAVYSLLSGAASAVLLIPEMKILSYSGSSGIHAPEKMEWYFGFFEEITRACTTASAYTGTKYWPNLYAGAFSFLLFFLFLLNRKIEIRKKLLGTFTVVFFFMSFSNNLLDFIWHGLHFPDSLPARQSFLYILVILLIGYSVVLKWDGIKNWNLIVAGVLSIALLIGGAMSVDDEITEHTSILITGLFILGYICLGILIRVSAGKKRSYFATLLIAVALGEIVIHMAVTGFYTTSRNSYVKNVENYEKLLAVADAREDGNFYRVEDIGRLTKNDDMRFGYASTTQFSSLMNINISHLFQSMYMEGGKNFYCYNGSTPLTSSLFSVKYILSNNGLLESDYRKLVANENGVYLYENKYCLPLGYMISEDAIAGWEDDRTDRMASLNSLGRSLGAEEPILVNTACEQVVEKGSTTITADMDGYYYVSYVSCNSDTLTAKMDDHGTRKYSKTTHRYLMELGELNESEQVTISNSKQEEIQFYVYRVNKVQMEKAYRTLTERGFVMTSFSDTRIEGSIEADKSGRLVFSIPCEEGWSIYVDGEKAEPAPWKEALLGVFLDEGTHEIVLEYETPGLKLGSIISIISAGIAIFLLVLETRKNDRMKKLM